MHVGTQQRVALTIRCDMQPGTRLPGGQVELLFMLFHKPCRSTYQLYTSAGTHHAQ